MHKIRDVIVENWQIFIGLLLIAGGEGLQAHDWAYHVVDGGGNLWRIHGFHIGLVLVFIGLVIIFARWLKYE